MRLTLVPLLLALALPAAADHHKQAAPAAEDRVAHLEIGGDDILFPVEPGLVSVKEEQPVVFELFQASLPERNRLVAAYATPRDLTAMLLGQPQRDYYFLVQVARPLEGLRLGAEEWEQLRPTLTAGMAQLDPNALAAQQQEGSGERMSEVAGVDVEVKYGRIEAPTIYASTPDTVRFLMSVPVEVKVGEGDQAKTESSVVALAGAILWVRQRMVFLYAYAPPGEEGAFEGAKDRLDALVAGMVAANAGEPARRAAKALKDTPPR